MLFVVTVALSACSKAKLAEQQSIDREASASSIPTKQVKVSPPSGNSIRSVDFSNFTFPSKAIRTEVKEDITLKNGRSNKIGDFGPALLTHLSYGDVTSDNDDDALVVLFISNEGTAKEYVIYIYSLLGESPKLLWSFRTGDRAQGGLRQLFAQDGSLFVELYGKNKSIGGDLYADDGNQGGACCPTTFTRTRYQWRDKHFQQHGEAELLSNPVGGAPIVMQRYEKSQ